MRNFRPQSEDAQQAPLQSHHYQFSDMIVMSKGEKKAKTLHIGNLIQEVYHFKHIIQ